MNIRTALLAATLGAASALFAMPALAKKIHAGNLSLTTTEDQLKTKFQAYGTVVSVKIFLDSVGRSRGFALVEMPDSEADAAIAALNGAELDGRQLTVTPQETPAAGNQRRGGFSGGWGR